MKLFVKRGKNLSELELCQQFSGPLLFDYVWWVLREAQRKGIHTLYFLARDGYVLYRMAQLFTEKYSLSVTCRYFYCSRASLRMPSYWLIGDEAYDLLLCSSYRLTLNTLLQRAECSEEEKNAVCKDCNFTNEDRQKLLSKIQLEEMGTRLRKSAVFRDLIEKKSHQAYETAIEYFQQEGFFFHPTVALVDSGWNGSIQRSIRQLLTSAGYKGTLKGFYFGMFDRPKSEKDGEYLTWYFSKNGQKLRKIFFNHNLFECLLSATHGMTIRYEKKNGKVIPILLQNKISDEGLKKVESHIRFILEYTKDRLNTVKFSDFSEEKAQHRTEKLVWKYMAHPTQEEASYYGSILFCDDFSDDYQIKLADASQLEKLKNYFILPRIMRKLFRRPTLKTGCDLLWPCGTIAFLPKWKQSWYRWNFFVWEWIRYLRQK